MARLVDRQRPAGSKVQAIRVLRVSRMMEREVGDAAFHSPELQIAGIDAELDKVYGRDNWELADVEGNHGRATWADFDVTGGTMDRDGLNAAIDALSTTSVQALGVYNISRWGRIVSDGLKRIQELQEAGAQLVSAKEPTNMFSPEGNFLVQLFLALGELQRRQAGVQWSDVIERRAEKQGRHHGVPPLGMSRPTNEATGKPSGDIEPDPGTGPILTYAFHLIDAGKSRWYVGHQLAAAGHMARWEYICGRFSPLTNRTYLRLHAKECVGTKCARLDPHGPYGEVRSFDYPRGEKKKRLGEVWFPGCHEGLIDVDVWDRVQARLKEMDEAQAALREGTAYRERVRRPIHELAGACRCQSCGKALWLGRVRKVLVLKDPSMQRTGCRGVGVPSADSVLAVVLGDLRAVVAATRPDAVRRAGQARRTIPTPRKTDLATLKRQRKGVDERIAAVEAEQAAGEYQGNAETTLANLRIKLAEIDSKEAMLSAPAPPPVVVPPAAAEFLRNYENLSVEERNGWFREHCTVIVSHRPEGAAWRTPYEERVKVRWAWDRS